MRRRCLELLRSLGLPAAWSRWHKLRTFPAPTWVLREDEVGGTKQRKYRSLIPALLEAGVKRVRLRGSPHSNHLFQMSLLLKQAGIRPYYVEEGRPGPIKGNGLWNRLVLGPDYLATSDGLDDAFEIPEGASTREALPGALTLACAVTRALVQCPEPLGRVVVDAGSGFSAVGLTLGLSHLYRGLEPPALSVVWLGSQEVDWTGLIARWLPEAPAWLELTPGDVLQPELVRVSTAASFGAVNAAILGEIARVAREEGVMLDPLYNAKVFHEARLRQSRGIWHEGTLLIHSGGSLSGYEERLIQVCPTSPAKTELR